MPVTQQDVAEAARVSVSTVCLVLRDDPRISERTRRRVLQAAQEVGYVARTALHAPGAPHHLGVLIAEGGAHPSADHFFGEVLRGVTEEAEQGGHTVSVAAFDGHDLPRLVREDRAHGLIMGGNPISEGVLERVRALTVPSVLIGRYPGRRAARHRAPAGARAAGGVHQRQPRRGVHERRPPRRIHRSLRLAWPERYRLTASPGF